MSEQTMTEEQQDLVKQVRQTKLNCIPILILVFLAIFIIHGIINLVNTSIEEHRIYAINIPEEHVFNCNATWDENTSSIKCPEQKIDGTYSKYDKTKLRVGYSDVNTKDNHFAKEISDYTIDPSLYVTESYDEEKVKNTNLETSITFSLYNIYLSRTMIEKTVHIRYKLTEEDLKLISDRNTEWKKQEAKLKEKPPKKPENAPPKKLKNAPRRKPENAPRQKKEDALASSKHQNIPQLQRTPVDQVHQIALIAIHLAPALILLLVDTATTAPMLQETRPLEAKPILVTDIKAGETIRFTLLYKSLNSYQIKSSFYAKFHHQKYSK